MRREEVRLVVAAVFALSTFVGCGSGNGTDRCANVTCPPPEASCDGDVQVTYSGAGTCNANDGTCNYANVTSRVDCTATGQVCRSGACVTPDPCENVTCDQPPDATCEGDTAVTYESTGTCSEGTCDYAEAGRTDCTQASQICVQGACEDPGLCYEVVCESPPPEVCDGSELVSYDPTGSCDPASGACSYPEASRTDCSADGGVCLDAACVNECTDVTCDQPPDAFCDGSDLVSYADPGTCDPATGDCSYAESRAPCPDGEVCHAGACVAASTVLPGDLVIDEVMNQPYIAPVLGQWFELHNPTDRTLDLSGLTFTKDPEDAAAPSFTLPADAGLTLEPDGYFVLGPNCIPDALGHEPLDYAYGNCDENTTHENLTAPLILEKADRLAIVGADGTTVIEDLSWDGGPVWPTPFSASMQLPPSPAAGDALDPTDGANWCPSRSVYFADTGSPYREFRGTPGAANEACIDPVTVTIQQIQDPSAAGHPAPQTPVRIEGVSLTWQYMPFLWVETPGGGEYSGLNIDVTGHAIPSSTLDRGDQVNLEGYVEELYGATILKLTQFEEAGTYYWIEPEVLDISVLDDPATAAPWEGVFIRLNGVGVLSNPDAGGMVHIGRNLLSGAVILPDYEFDPTQCSFYETLSGLLNFRNGHWELLPNTWHGAGTLAATESTVQVVAGAFSPRVTCVGPPTATVTWENQRGADAILSGDFALTVPAGGSASHAFSGIGTYGYQDAAGIRGYVIVHQ